MKPPLLLIMLATGSALAQSPVIRVSLSPSRNVIVGQPVHLRVTILVPNYFTGSPDFPAFAIDNAVVVEPQDRPENLNDTIGGISYAGISQTYTIYPQQAAEFKLPPAQFTVAYASAPPKTTEAHLFLPPLTFHADIPAVARTLPYFLPTSRLTLQQKWNPSPKNLRVGDTIYRTIIVTTNRTQGMMIPPLPLKAPDGIRIYTEQPTVINQKTTRGEFIYGRRTESARYFMQKAGDYTLSAIQLQWWNLDTNKLATAILPAVRLSVAENPGYVDELPPQKEPVSIVQPVPISFWKHYCYWIKFAALSLTTIPVFLWLGRRYLPRLYSYVGKRIKHHRHSEKSYFRRLLRACKSNDAEKAYRELLAWISHSGKDINLNIFLRKANNEALIAEIEQLGKFLYANSPVPSWNGYRLASLLSIQRHLILMRRKSKISTLASLNT